MIHDGICTYELCKLAKEKGFPQHIGNDAYIVENEYDDEYEVGSCYPIQFIPDYLPTIAAPTQSLLQRWLREEKNLHISIDIDLDDDYTNYVYGFNITYRKNEEGGLWGQSDLEYYPTYELALENALKYALEKLA